MNIQRYVGPTMTKVLRRIRQEQGGAAIILSSRDVEGGVEVITAIEQEDAVALLASDDVGFEKVFSSIGNKPGTTGSTPNGDIYQLQKEIQGLRQLIENRLTGLASGKKTERGSLQTEVFKRLSELGMSRDVCQLIVGQVDLTCNASQAWRQALKILMSHLILLKEGILDRGGVVALVGPTGVGKTTTIAKLAARFVMRHGAQSVALVTADCFRVGALEQLKVFADLIRIPLNSVKNHKELHDTIKRLADRKLILIDTAGMSQRDIRLTEQLGMLCGGDIKVDTYLVLSASASNESMDDVISRFSAIDIKGCILTKLDESIQVGGSLGILLKNKLPLAYISEGQNVPEDLHPAKPKSLLNRLMNFTKPKPSNFFEEFMAGQLRKEMTYGQASA